VIRWDWVQCFEAFNPATCRHEGIGLPGCEKCDANTERVNAARQWLREAHRKTAIDTSLVDGARSTRMIRALTMLAVFGVVATCNSSGRRESLTDAATTGLHEHKLPAYCMALPECQNFRCVRGAEEAGCCPKECAPEK